MWGLDDKEGWTPENWCVQIVVLENTLEKSLGQQGDQTSQSWRKSTLDIHWKDWCWSRSSSTLDTLMQWTDLLEKTLMLNKIEGMRRRGRQGMRWLDGIIDSVDMSLSNLLESVKTGKPGMHQSFGSQREITEWLNWTELIWFLQIGKPNLVGLTRIKN